MGSLRIARITFMLQAVAMKRIYLCVSRAEEFWANRDLPFYDLPDRIVTHVSTKAWREMTEEVCRPHRPCRPEQEEIDRQKVVLGVSPN